MALLWMDGFDSGEYMSKYSGGSVIGFSAITRFGVGRSINTSNGGLLGRSFPAASQIFIGFALYHTQMDGRQFNSQMNIHGDNGGTTHLIIGLQPGLITLYRGNGSTPIASANVSLMAGIWYNMEISATIADSGGTCVIKWNGITIINFTGDTKNGGTNNTIDYFGFMGAFGTCYDDYYICDSTGPAPSNTFLGDVRVYPLVPNGAGSSTQFTSSGGANYTTVDEIPYSATDNVTSTTPGNKDLYTLSDLPTSVTAIYGVQNNVIAKKTDAATTTLKSAIKSGSTVYYGADMPLANSDVSVLDFRTVDPNTSAPWTIGGVNALEAGFEQVL